MEVDPFDNPVWSYIGSPKHLGGKEGIILASQDKSESVERCPAHERTTDIDIVIIVPSRVGGVARGGITIVRSTELDAAEEVSRQLKICVQSQPEPPAVPVDLVVVSCRVWRRRKLLLSVLVIV